MLKIVLVLLFDHFISKRYQKVPSWINLRVWHNGFCHLLWPLCTVFLKKIRQVDYGENIFSLACKMAKWHFWPRVTKFSGLKNDFFFVVVVVILVVLVWQFLKIVVFGLEGVFYSWIFFSKKTKKIFGFFEKF